MYGLRCCVSFAIFNNVYSSTVRYTVDVKCWWNVNIIRLFLPQRCCRWCSAMFHYHHRRRRRHHKLLSLPLPSIRIFQNQLTHMHQNRSTIRRFPPITSSRNNNSIQIRFVFAIKTKRYNAIEWTNISCDDGYSEHDAAFLFHTDEIKKEHPPIHPQWYEWKDGFRKKVHTIFNWISQNFFLSCVCGWMNFINTDSPSIV